MRSNHVTGENDNPAGGSTSGTGFDIRWQNGPMVGPDGQPRAKNGAFVEDIIGAVVDRLEYYQTTKFACDQNADAIGLLEDVLFCLQQRTRDRQARGVEGTHEV